MLRRNRNGWRCIGQFFKWFVRSRPQRPQKKLDTTTGCSELERRFLGSLSSNPYLQSKVLWNDMYGSLQVKLENAYRIILILSMVIIFAMVGLIIIAGETKVKPYVTVIHGNEVLTLDQTSDQAIQSLHPQLALYFAKQFIRDARSVRADNVVNAKDRMNAYAFVADAAVETLKDFYETRQPNGIAAHRVNTIQLTSVLRLSAHTFEIHWMETWCDVQTGKIIATQHYIGQLQYQFDKPSSNTRILRANPFGFYITQLSWSHDQTV